MIYDYHIILFPLHGKILFINENPSTAMLRGNMPQRILCSKCGEVLYEGDLLKSPQDIIKKFEGKCPECGKDLCFETDGVKVKPCENS
jgi:NAD-dependent SIR2 family protein deacetylase